MRKTFTNMTPIWVVLLMLVGLNTYAQSRLSGKITDATTKEPLIGVSIQLKGKVTGTITDINGAFAFSTSVPMPLALVVSMVGYKSQEVVVKTAGSPINIVLEEQVIMGEEVVVAASRVEEKVLQSPASIEKIDIRAIRESPSPDFYSSIGNLKGVDMASQGVLFKSVNMRGFGATGNPRIMQQIDGMDNSAPGLNFPVDNIVGMPEIDVESVEILPGAASALYGPNALNGIILMNSKSPFLYQGLSASLKAGTMQANNRQIANTGFSDFSVRYAKAFNNRFAFKVNFSTLKATDWENTNYNNLNVAPDGSGGNADPNRGAGTFTNYDGMNVYGDEAQANISTVATSMVAGGLLPSSLLGLIPNQNVSRTGITERFTNNPDVYSIKSNMALHYRINEKLELIGQWNYGKGTTPYTGNGRYSLSNFEIQQAKIELRGDNFMLRAFTTQENSGDSYTQGLAAVYFNEAWKSSTTWFGQYTGAFAQARAGGQTEAAAHLAARAVADAGRPVPGSEAFNTLWNTVKGRALNSVDGAGNLIGGGKFLDRSNMYHAEGTYNFKNQIKFADVLIGGNYRRYNLVSEGTLFPDINGRKISIDEYGAFAQVSKAFGPIKLSGSLRYDKNENFNGQYTPRLSAVYTKDNHNFRVSYQTGFRIPTTQNQYIDLRTAGGTLIGGLPEFDTRYKLGTGVLRETLVDFSTNPTKYITSSVIAQAQAYATAAVTAQLPAIQAGVVAAVQAQVTSGVTAAVQAQVAAGTLPASAAAAAIAAGVAQQMASSAIQATIASNVQSTVVQQVTAVTTKVAPAYGLAALPKYQAKALKPERIVSYEIGYKGLIAKKLFLDTYYYYSTYKDFIGGTTVVVPTATAGPGLPIESGLGSATTRAGYSRPANSDQDITVSGWAIGFQYALSKGYNFGGNIASNSLQDFIKSPEVQFSAFNTPKNRYNLNFGKRPTGGSKWGFSVAYRAQDSFTWESGYVQPSQSDITAFTNTVVPATSIWDAQFSYKVSSLKSIIKIGGTNIMNTPYIQAYGNPTIGAMYYVSINFDELLN